MIPVGFLFKKIVTHPDWLKADGVEDIYSLSNCISEDFADYINYWKHNGYWLFDSPKIMKEIATEKALDLSEMTLFYYEVFEEEFDGDSHKWSAFEPEKSFPTNVRKPAEARLEGYDVTTFFAHTSPECSPLSCNGLADRHGKPALSVRIVRAGERSPRGWQIRQYRTRALSHLRGLHRVTDPTDLSSRLRPLPAPRSAAPRSRR